AGQKLFIEFASSDDVKRFFPHRILAYGEKSQGYSALQFFLFEKCNSCSPGWWWNKAFLVAEFGGRLRGGNDGSLVVHQLKKIQLLCVCHALGFVEISAGIEHTAV